MYHKSRVRNVRFSAAWVPALIDRLVGFVKSFWAFDHFGVLSCFLFPHVIQAQTKTIPALGSQGKI